MMYVIQLLNCIKLASSGIIYSFCQRNHLPFIISCVRSAFDVPPNVRKRCPAKQSADQEISEFLSFCRRRDRTDMEHLKFDATLAEVRWAPMSWVEFVYLGKESIYRIPGLEAYSNEFSAGQRGKWVFTFGCLSLCF